MHECCMNTFTHMEDLCMYNAACNNIRDRFIYHLQRVVEIVLCNGAHCKASFKPCSHVTSTSADKRLCSRFNVCILTARKRSLEQGSKVIFVHVSVILSTRGGGRLPSMHHRSHDQRRSASGGFAYRG